MTLVKDAPRTPAPPAAPLRSRGERPESFDLADFPLPTGREEEWRFSPMARLRPLLDDALIDGRLPVEVDLPEGCSTRTVGLEEVRRLTPMAPADRAAALAASRAEGVAGLWIDDEATPVRPAALTVRGHGSGVSHDHRLLVAGRHSRATVVVDHVGGARHNDLLSVVVQDGACLTLISVHRWDDESVHTAQVDALVGRDATFRHVAVTLGGAVVRANVNVRYAGPGGTAELLGVYFADEGQHLEHRTFVDHNQPNCHSDVLYKGALQGDSARSVWIGDVLIRAAAEGTQTYELNRNLLLTPGARADSVPNLEIETGEIAGAGHASTTGRFDDEHLFYLQSRGVPADAARRMVVRAFFGEIVRKIGVPELQQQIMAAVDAELGYHDDGSDLDEATATDAAFDEATA